MTVSSLLESLRPVRFLALATVAAVLTAGGCASGPSDYVHLTSLDQQKAKGPAIKDANQQIALTNSLNAQRRGQDASLSASAAALPETSALALTTLRQQQTEEAKALLVESGAEAENVTSVACPDATDTANPGCSAAATP